MLSGIGLFLFLNLKYDQKRLLLLNYKKSIQFLAVNFFISIYYISIFILYWKGTFTHFESDGSRGQRVRVCGGVGAKSAEIWLSW